MDTDLSSFETHIFLSIRRVMHSVERYSRLLMQKYGLSGPQLAVLRELEQNSPASPASLSEQLEIGPPTMTGVLKRLEQRGLISRQRDPADRRNHILRLTEIGRRLLSNAPSLLEGTFREQLHQLQLSDQFQFSQLLEQLADMMNLNETNALRVFDSKVVEEPADAPETAALPEMARSVTTEQYVAPESPVVSWMPTALPAVAAIPAASDGSLYPVSRAQRIREEIRAVVEQSRAAIFESRSLLDGLRSTPGALRKSYAR